VISPYKAVFSGPSDNAAAAVVLDVTSVYLVVNIVSLVAFKPSLVVLFV
jgi:hypothetical protein